MLEVQQQNLIINIEDGNWFVIFFLIIKMPLSEFIKQINGPVLPSYNSQWQYLIFEGIRITKVHNTFCFKEFENIFFTRKKTREHVEYFSQAEKMLFDIKKF